METWNLKEGTYPLADQLGDRDLELQVTDGQASAKVNLDPLESLILKVR